ncbi:posterior protein-like [Pyxicephalus adspersus]|uniref:posterior protein-like n=1 Tax=Pyxicephalus adspersus TaxID=30357 RepID=UPI003B5C6BBE
MQIPSLWPKRNAFYPLVHKKASESANICTLTEMNTCRGVQSADTPRAARENASTLTVQDKYHLCQILDEFNGLESPVSISNKLEAVVCQYSLNNEDACALLKAWLPGPLAAQISMNNEQLVGAEGRRKELQRVLGSRDRRGTQDLSRMKFRRGDDPIIFCNEYLSLYRVVYNCPDMSSDDMEFLYLMANKCFVSYPVRVALRNASSYQQFINILRDWCEQDKERYTSDISVIYRSTRRPKSRPFRCNRPGHIKRYCRSLNVHKDHTKIANLIAESNEENIDESTTPIQDNEITLQPGVKDNNYKNSASAAGGRKDINSKNDQHPQNGQEQGWTNIPMFAPGANLPYWLVCSLPQAALPFFPLLYGTVVWYCLLRLVY